MNIEDYNVQEYVEEFDGPIEKIKLVMMVEKDWGIYKRGDGERFLIKDYKKDDEYIYRIMT